MARILATELTETDCSSAQMRELILASPKDPSSSSIQEPDQLRRPLAYREEAFLQSPESRPLRIISEYLWPLAHFQDEKIHDTIVFFGSARIAQNGPLGRYYREARELSRMVTEWSASLAPPKNGSEVSHRFVVCTG